MVAMNISALTRAVPVSARRPWEAPRSSTAVSQSETPKMRTHLENDRFGKNRYFAGKQRTDAEGVGCIGDAALPIADIGAKLLQRIWNVLLQRGDTGFGLVPVL